MMENILDVIKHSRQLLTNCQTLCDKMETDFLANKLTNEIKEENVNEIRQEFKMLKRNFKIAKKINIKSIIKKSAKIQNGDGAEKKKVDQNNFFNDKNNVEKTENSLNSKKRGKVDKITISNKCGANFVILSDLSEIGEDKINNNIDEEEKMIEEAKKSNLLKWDDENIDQNREKIIINSDNVDNNNKILEKSIINNNDDIIYNKIDEGEEKMHETEKLNCDDEYIDKNIEKSIINKDNDDENIDYNINEKKKKLDESEKSNLMECDDENIDKNIEKSIINSDNDDKIDNNDGQIVNRTENERNLKQCFVILEDISKADKNIISEKIDVDKLSEIPQFKNAKSRSNDKEEDDVEKNKTDKEYFESLYNEMFESVFDAKDSNSDQKSEHITEIDLTDAVMNDVPLSSTESNTDDDSIYSFKPAVNNIAKNDAKSRVSVNKFKRRITRSLKITLLSDSKTSYKTDRRLVKISTISITSSSKQSDDELDTLPLELRNLTNNKRNKRTKSIEGSKKQKLEDDSDGKDGLETSKNLRKVLTEAKLSEATKTAELFEIERKKKLQEKQEMYNNSLARQTSSSEETLSSLIIEKDEKGDVLVEVHGHIAEKLKHHQVEDISEANKKLISDEIDVDKLSEIPQFKNAKSNSNDKEEDYDVKKNTDKEFVDGLYNEMFESVSDANHSDLNQKSDQLIKIDLTDDVMNITLNSSESNTDDSFKPSVYYRAKSRVSVNKFKRRITRSLKMPLISDPERSSETDLKVINTSTISTPSSIMQLGDELVNKIKTRLRSIEGSEKQKIYDGNGGSKRRKNIRKVLTEAKLSEDTKNAELFEVERKKRMQEKKEMYNNSLARQTASEETLSSLIIEKDEKGDVLVEVHGHIAEKLKPHQVEVVYFIYDCVIESVACLLKYQGRDKDDGVEEKESSVGGCIVAHCMGLGKTLSLIAFMHTMLTTPVLNLSSCIIVCPVNTAMNWKREWEMWVPPDMPVKIFEVCSSECKKSKIAIVQDWHKKGGVLIIGYEMFRLLTAEDRRTIRNKVVRDKIQEALVNPGADFIVCDEGHLLKNEKSAISKVINKVKTRCRIVLTGTPLQNRLLEYHTMVNFVKPNLLGTQKEFLNRFVNPISNGQHINSTPYDVNVMKKRSHILFKTLDGCVHRRDYSALVKYLPPKLEYVIKIRMSEVQRKLYEAYLTISKINKQGLFQDQTSLARIWTHPFLVCMHQEIQDKKMFFAESDGESFLDDDSDGDSEEDFKTAKKSKKPLEENNIISLLSDESDNDKIKEEKKKKEDIEGSLSSNSSVEEVVKKWGTSTRSSRRNKLVESDEEPKIDIKFELENLRDTNTVSHWWSDIISPEHEHQIEVSGKLTVLFQILRKAGDMGDKVIIFSHSLLVLDLIERYLLQLHNISETVKADLSKLTVASEIGEGGGEAVSGAAFLEDIGYNSWEKGIDYDRMDGSTQVVVRSDIQARFNNEKEKRLRLFLISTKAGGMGVNLVAANRIVIFDVSWNPSNDIQAIFRSYRFGQNKPVYVYRLVSQGTMEEKMYERQVTKQSISLRVVDEQQISRYFTEEDLRSLYKFEPDIYDENDKERETPILPKDRFLAELIQEFPRWIVGYHEHDSLLQNKNEEELTEAERQEAWKEFEDEKIRGTRHIHNPLHQQQISIDPNLFAQSQMAMMQQHYPQYAAIYAQNYMNLLRYALSQQPDLKFNPTQLSVRMQAIFFMSLQKYNNNNNSIASSSVTPETTAITTAAAITVDKEQSASSSSSSIMMVAAPEESTSQLNNE